jgi:methionyl aminopeptidase
MNILDKEQIKLIKICGHKLAKTLSAVVLKVVPGADLGELDALAYNLLIKEGCKPSFKDYHVEGIGDYPTTLCVSVNDEIVHGIPVSGQKIKSGDVVSIDIGAEYEGIYTDMATTVAVGKISNDAKHLISGTKKSLEIGIKHALAGKHIGDIGANIEDFAKSNDFGIIRDYVGHGIGTKPHLPPQIPNFGLAGSGAEIVEGMALAIEPMLTLGGEKTVVAEDGWTVKTQDGSLAAHFEHTVVIENSKPTIVTL